MQICGQLFLILEKICHVIMGMKIPSIRRKPFIFKSTWLAQVLCLATLLLSAADLYACERHLQYFLASLSRRSL